MHCSRWHDTGYPSLHFPSLNWHGQPKQIGSLKKIVGYPCGGVLKKVPNVVLSSTTHDAISVRTALTYHETAHYLSANPGRWSTTEVRHIYILGKVHTFSMLALILINGHAECGRASPQLSAALSSPACTLPGAFVLCSVLGPVAAFFRALPEYAVLAKASPSAI